MIKLSREKKEETGKKDNLQRRQENEHGRKEGKGETGWVMRTRYQKIEQKPSNEHSHLFKSSLKGC